MLVIAGLDGIIFVFVMGKIELFCYFLFYINYWCIVMLCLIMMLYGLRIYIVILNIILVIFIVY